MSDVKLSETSVSQNPQAVQYYQLTIEPAKYDG